MYRHCFRQPLCSSREVGVEPSLATSFLSTVSGGAGGNVRLVAVGVVKVVSGAMVVLVTTAGVVIGVEAASDEVLAFATDVLIDAGAVGFVNALAGDFAGEAAAGDLAGEGLNGGAASFAEGTAGGGS
jgi:hypothetical protein